MNNLDFTKNPFSVVKNTNLHNHMNNIEHTEPQIHVNDLQTDFKNKVDNINNLRRMK